MDSRLRELERAQDGSPEAWARWWRARLRVETGCECWEGLVGSEDGRESVPCPDCGGTGNRLRHMTELAAYCGHEGARLVVDPYEWDVLCLRCKYPVSVHPVFPLPEGGKRVCSPAPAFTFTEWLSGLSHWNALPRAAVAAGWAAHARKNCTCSLFGPCAKKHALRAAEAWLADPSEENREAWWDAEFAFDPPDWLPHPSYEDEAGHIQAAARLAGEAPVRSAICAALIEWSLNGR